MGCHAQLFLALFLSFSKHSSEFSQLPRILLNNTSTDLIFNCCNNHKLTKWLLNLL